jgi:hypothetical protein
MYWDSLNRTVSVDNDTAWYVLIAVHRFVYGNRDLTRVMAEELGYYVDLGPGPNKHTWGAALLSKFPILNSTHHLLPSPHGELAPAIHATLDIHGEKVNVWVSHNGQGGLDDAKVLDRADRQRRMRWIASCRRLKLHVTLQRRKMCRQSSWVTLLRTRGTSDPGRTKS